MEKTIKRRKTSEFIKIKQLSKICEKYGIKRIKWDNLELEFGDKPRSARGIKYQTDKTASYLETPNLDMPPDDILLFAATDHFDNILDDRKAARKE